MAERLTKKDKPILKNQMEDNMSVNERTAIKRLWQYENVMEKYGIESVEELDKKIADTDTWKRACELMGEELDMYATKEDNTISTAQYFYQQAKKGG